MAEASALRLGRELSADVAQEAEEREDLSKLLGSQPAGDRFAEDFDIALMGLEGRELDTREDAIDVRVGRIGDEERPRGSAERIGLAAAARLGRRLDRHLRRGKATVGGNRQDLLRLVVVAATPCDREGEECKKDDERSAHGIQATSRRPVPVAVF